MAATDKDVLRAKDFAAKAHASIGHKRKYTGEDYFVHPMEVAAIVSTVPHTKEMLMAAYLHDTVEDTPVTIEEIRAEFGEVVADHVADLTDVSVPTDGNRAERKAKDLAHTAQGSPGSKTVKLADLISNTKSIVAHDHKFATVYLEEKAKTLEVLTEGDPTLHAEAMKILFDGFLAIKLHKENTLL